MRMIYTAAALCLVAMTADAFAVDAKPVVPNFDLTLKNHKYTPNAITVPAETKFTLTVKNEDKTPAEFESHQLKREKVIKGGETAIIKFGPLKAGQYIFEDEFHEETAHGVMTVQ